MQLQSNFCVIIPTYNNHKTLKRVLDGVLNYTQNVIVINDGSTDETASILSQYQLYKLISLPLNKGKGNALKIGFQTAKNLGFDYAITIDSDGQHYPDDLIVFQNEIEKYSEPQLLIGSRNMNQEGVPKKSSFGNKFSNFWFWFETGIQLEDTQSGYRCYPLKYLPKKLYTRKFELEIEVIVRTAWNGVMVRNVPVKILYDPNERVSHFRPFKDFTRISILNTVLVIITLLYIKPRDFFKSFKKKSIKRFFLEDVIHTQDSPKTKAFSIALGLFIGLSPLWGLHTFLAISLAILFNLNKVITFTFSNISIPPMIPFILYGSFKIGGLFFEKPIDFIPKTLDLNFIKQHFLQYCIGSVLLAFIVSILVGWISYFIILSKTIKK